MKQWMLIFFFAGTLLVSEFSEAAVGLEPALAVAKTNTLFGIDLVKTFLKKNASESFLVSPVSLQLVLGMAIAGARGDTMKAIEEVTHFKDLPPDNLYRGLSQIQAILRQGDPSIELSMANSMWVKQGFLIRPEYLAHVKGYYDAEVRVADFRSKATVTAMNQWVSQSTRGRIASLVEKIDDQARLFLLNAFYFEGKWSIPFEPSQTRPRPFKGIAGVRTVHMMTRSGRFYYFKGANFQAVRLPFGNKRYSMWIFSPDKSASLRSFYPLLTGKNWETWMTQFQQRSGSLSLPKFTLNTTVPASELLKQMGMGIAFSYLANFSAINGGTGEGELKVSQVLQKTHFSVSEQGAQAAAASAVAISLTSVQDAEKPFNMVMDHPFFFAVGDNQTGILLLMGAYCNPE